MLTVISPSKTQNFDQTTVKEFSMPNNLTNSNELVKILKKLSHKEIKNLMSISDNLAKLNYNRYQDFHTPFNLSNAKQALLAFKGDVYSGITIDNYTKNDFSFAQQNLRILSGLYGLLAPMDLIQAYRLEMGIKLVNKNGANLYKFWAKTISNEINKHEKKILVNLASNEYFKAIDKKYLMAKILQIDFKELKNNKYKTIGIYAKKARGLMVNFIIKNRITDHTKLINFNSTNYKFNQKLSNNWHWIFTRKAPINP